MIDSDSQHDRPSDESGSHAADQAGQSDQEIPSSVVDGGSAAGLIQFSTDPHISPDDQTVVAANPAASGAVLPPKVPTSGDLGKMLVGERLGHFQLEQFIGGGGMGAVFRGTDEMLGRTVAIKVLSPQQGAGEEATRRFRHEAQSTARLDHDHIARVYYVGVDRGWHYIVLEYVEGENLRDLVALNGPLPFADVISYTVQISEALDHASGRDVVHRDIKPSNVLITKKKQAKLVDMGLARLHQVDNPEDDLTASGVTLGTFDYISPEQARDPRIADVRSDLYSLGCTVFFMLTGRPPFPQGTVLQKLLQHQGDAPPDPRRFRPDIPEAICAFTAKLLAKNPAHRYQRPNDLILELLSVSRQLDLPVSTNVVEEWAPQKTPRPTWVSRHLPWAIPVAALIAIIVFSYLRDGLWAGTPSFPEGTSASTSSDQAERSAPATPSVKSSDAAPNSAEGPANAAVSENVSPTESESPSDPDISADRSSTSPTGQPLDEPVEASAIPANDANVDASSSPVESDSTPAVVVGNQDDADYKTLAAACREVGDSATIELRYDGRALAAEEPIELENKQLTIRGGEGFSPVVRFRPTVDTAKRRRNTMFQVSRGRLTLVNVHVELDIPNARTTDRYSLFEAKQAERIELRKCTVTVRDKRDLREYDDRPTILHVSAASHQGFLSDARWDDLDDVMIDLEDCIVRGEADFLTGDALGAVTLNWQNGLLAVDHHFVETEASENSGPTRGRLQINLDHVTADARRGLCNMSGGDDARYFPIVKINCVDSILLTNGAPLIEQRSWHRQSELLSVIRWSGHNNFFAGFELFWLVDSEYGAITKRLDWDEWKSHWPMRSDSSHLGVQWQREVAKTDTISGHRVEDYRLRANDNPAVGGATDGMSDVGLRAIDLPRFPAPPTRDVE